MYRDHRHWYIRYHGPEFRSLCVERASWLRNNLSIIFEKIDKCFSNEVKFKILIFVLGLSSDCNNFDSLPQVTFVFEDEHGKRQGFEIGATEYILREKNYKLKKKLPKLCETRFSNKISIFALEILKISFEVRLLQGAVYG